MVEESVINVAVIGVGIMGSNHVREVHNSGYARLAAVCDIDQERADRLASEYQVPATYSYTDLLEADNIDAVVVATPHYDHTPISIDFLKKGISVMVEKPIAVHINDAQKMIAAYEDSRKKYPELVFGIMFQQRTYGFWMKVKEMIDQGELGKLVRATWLITDWFRTQFYYDNGGWRATWKGEGGGVLLNQCPHNLDLYQWFFGMPNRIAGFASIGKYHHIEVEDEVTGYFEHENGMVGHFITTTAESPGTNRLEIVGEKGKLVFEDERLTLYRNKGSMFEFIRTAQSAWDKVEYEVEEVPYNHHGEPGHKLVLERFFNAIQRGGTLVAPAVEGINSLILSNGIMLSHFLQKPVDLPLDGDAYEGWLNDMIYRSTFKKEVRGGDVGDIRKSFGFQGERR